MKNPLDHSALPGLGETRRRFFGRCADGAASALGLSALASLGERGTDANFAGPHHRPRAKQIIYLHMEGAPSQLDLFDYKPKLRHRFQQDLPDSIRQGQRLTGMTSGQARFPVAPSIFRFSKYEGEGGGLWLSELLPHLGEVAHELLLVKSMHTDAINHEPGITFFQTGTEQPGRPSFGAWTSYGLGSLNRNLPTFAVMITQGKGNMQALSARFWGAGFLPSEHQGCKLRVGSDPVLFLQNPDGVTREDRRAFLDVLGTLNREEFAQSGDPEILARLAQHEMAYRMQMSVPELTDFSGESADTLGLYGPDVLKPGTFAGSCLLARRLVERGTRFVQLYMRGWDAHGNLPNEIKLQCEAVDQPIAGLLKDLRRRGLLDETLVLFGGEFGRTVYSQGELTAKNYGRDHHPRCFSIWMAGAGLKKGMTYGETDEFSYNITENPVSVHDLHATLLHLLGIDHERLVYRYQGRDFRLTDVAGRVMREWLA